MNPGLQAVGALPPTPTVFPIVYVNPTVWQSGTWAALHPDYFVVRGTAGNGPLAAGQVLTVSINGATYRADASSPQVPGVFHVDATGNWAVYILSVGDQPATIPASGFLAPWSTTNSDAYNVIAMVTDAAGNSRTDATTREIEIDMIAPVLTNVSSTTPAGTYTVGDVLNIYVEYNEPIRVVGNPTLAINVLPQPKTAAFVGVTGNRVNFEYVVQPGDSVAALDYLDANSLQLNGGFIEDLAANLAPIVLEAPVPVLPGPPPTQPSLSGQKTIAIDTAAPVLAAPFVTSLSPDGIYVVGSPTIIITVAFSKPVFVDPSGGTPRLQLNAAAGRFAEYVSGSGTNVLSFQYNVVAGDSTPDLDYVSTSALQLNGGQIQDSVGNDAVLALPAPGAPGSLGDNKAIQVVAQPQVLQVSSPDPAGLYTAGQTVRIRVMFSNEVTAAPGPTPLLQLGTSPTTAVATWARYIDAAGNPSAAATNISEFDYLVQPGDTTDGQFLNYLAPTALIPGAGMNFVWTGPATPNVLVANVALPPLVSASNVLPNAQIVIGPDIVAPAAPIMNLETDTFNAIGVSPTDGITSNPVVAVSGLETRFGTTWQYQYEFLGGVPSGWLAGGPISATGTSTFTLATTTPVNAVYPVGSVQIRQTDWSGNVSPIGVNPQQWTIDINAPAPPTAATITETGGAGSGITNNPLVTVSGLEANAIFQYNLTYNSGTNAVNAAAWTTVASGNTFSLPQGTYNPATGTGVVVRQQDLAGNFSPAPPWTQLSTASGSTVIVVTLDTSIVPPVIDLAQDTTPGFAPYTGAPYTTDGVTRIGLINVTGLETQDLTATPPRSGIARWEYRVNGGAWVLGGTTAPTSSFTLAAGVYPPGSVEVREFDLAGNQATVANTSAWTVDLVNPVITSLSAAAGPYGPGQTVPITVNFSEPIFLSAATASLSLNVPGRTATLVTPVPVGGAGTSSLTFNYVVQVGDATPALAVTAMNLNGSLIADLAGNPGTGILPANPVVLGGPVVIDAGIRAFSPALGSTPPGPVIDGTILNIPIVFTTPVQNLGIRAFRLFLNDRAISLSGAVLTGSGANYNLRIPSNATNLRGSYRLEVNGQATGVVSVAGNVPMTVTSNIYWQNGIPSAPPPSNPTLTPIGPNLSYDSSNGDLYAYGVQVTLSGTSVNYNTYASQGWHASAAAMPGGVNSIVWRHASGNLHFWRLSTGWAHVSSDGWEAPGSTEFFATETAFQTDLNSDGIIGAPGSGRTLTALESNGSVTLARDAQGDLYANGQRITLGGAPVDYFGYAAQGWTAVAADVRDGVNTLVWRHASGNLHFWRLSSAWAHVLSEGWEAPGSSAFDATEVSFQTDFDGNGIIGQETVIEGVGSVRLSRDSNGYLYANGQQITLGGSPVNFFSYAAQGWAAAAADVREGVNTLVWLHSSGHLHYWRLSSAWAHQLSEGWVAPGSAEFHEAELAFGVDFNGNGILGG